MTDVAGNNRMMRGYLDTGNSNPSTVTVAGMTSGTYSIYVYVDGDNATASRTAVYQISGTGMPAVSTSLTDTPNTNFGGTFIPAANASGNYVLFGSVKLVSGFTLTASPGANSDGSPRAPVNGIQIIPVSVPNPDFTIAATPASQAVTAGNLTSYKVAVGAVNGFAGTVTLSTTGLPAGAAASFNPAAITGSGTSTLTVTTIGSTPVGTVTLAFKGVSGALSHSAAATLVVGAAPHPVSLNINFAGSTTTPMASSETAGVVASSNWNNASGASSSSALSLVSNQGLSTGASVAWTSDNAWDLPISDVAGNTRMMRGYLDNANGNPSTVAFSGIIAGTYNIYVYTDGDNGGSSRAGTYQISGAGITTTSIGVTDAPNTDFNGTFVQANNSSGNYILFSGVTISSGVSLIAIPGATTDYPRAPVSGIQIVPVVPDFTISVAPGSLSLKPGGSATLNVSIAALNGFSGTVSLTASGTPSGTSVQLSPASVTQSGSVTATVTVSGTTATGTSTLTISAVSGSLSHTATTALTVLANQPPTVSAGSNQNITLPGTAQLSGTVTDDGSPNGVLSSSWSLVSGPGTVVFGNAQSAAATASFSTAGTYVLALTASDGALTGSAQCTVTVTSVAISLTPGSTTLLAGKTQQFTAIISGSSNSAVSWSISPVTGSISSTGLYTAPSTLASNQTVTVTATSAADPTKSSSVPVLLNPQAASPLTINISSLPAGTGNVPYSTTLGAVGGISPYTWSIQSGNLPPGVSLTSSSGLISGTSQAGSFSFIVGVTDSVGIQATRSYSITMAVSVPSYYVSSVNGNDSWSGLLPSPNMSNTDGPFRSLGKAQATMEGSSTKTVYLRAGTYTLTATITFTGSDNGETWQNYPGEAPVIDGASTCQFIIDGTSDMTFKGLTFQHYPSAVYNYRGAGQVGDFIGSGSNVTWNYNTFLNCINQCIMTTFSNGTTITNNTFNGQTGGPGTIRGYLCDSSDASDWCTDPAQHFPQPGRWRRGLCQSFGKQQHG